MHIILLSGGSGTRLWPLSNDIRSKQFIKFFKDEHENYESMVQRIYRQIRAVDTDATVTIATSAEQVSLIKNQLGENVSISVEPCRRDTFPAIVLASAYLHDVLGVSGDESVVVCPVDPYVEDDYFLALHDLWDLANTGKSNLVLMGVQPTYPSEKYGYIIPVDKEDVSRVSCFKEKPDLNTAKEYIENGGLWNGGVFAYKLSYLLKKAHQIMQFDDYDDLHSKYRTLKKISFDYAVVEHEESILVKRFYGKWKDIGTWNTLTETMNENTIGNALIGQECSNVHVVNELEVPILTMGLEDVVVAASPQGILVSNKDQSSYIKPYVEEIDPEIMFAEKSWGTYRVLNVTGNSMTIKITLKAGQHMNYHSHEHRDEVWVVISGEGKTIVDGMGQHIHPGDVITMTAGCKHTVIAIQDLQMIEVQLGKNISVDDKRKYKIEL